MTLLELLQQQGLNDPWLEEKADQSGISLSSPDDDGRLVAIDRDGERMGTGLDEDSMRTLTEAIANQRPLVKIEGRDAVYQPFEMTWEEFKNSGVPAFQEAIRSGEIVEEYFQKDHKGRNVIHTGAADVLSHYTGTKDDPSFFKREFGKGGMFNAALSTVGAAYGLSNFLGAGLTSLANGGGSLANWAASMLPEGGYQSLFSALNGTNAATGGLGGVSSVPDSYWNMLADGGQATSDAAPVGGFFNNPSTGLMDFSSPAGAFTATPGLSLNSLGNASGIAVNAGLPVGSSMSFLDDLFSAKNLVSLAGNLGSSLIQSSAIDKATGAQIDSAGASNALLRDMYMQNRADLEPWRATGVNALGRLNALTKPGSQVSEMEMDPGYNFRLNEGVKALDRSAAARGMFQSGAQMKGVTRYGQDYATGEYGNIINRNLALSGLGQAATNTGIQAGQNYGNQASQNLTGAGNARASGYVGNANALSGGIGGFLNNYSQNALLDRVMGGR